MEGFLRVPGSYLIYPYRFGPYRKYLNQGYYEATPMLLPPRV